MKIITYVITALLVLLGSAALAQEPSQGIVYKLSPEWSNPVGDFSPVEGLTNKALPAVVNHDGGGAQMCTIIPWFCDPD